MTPVQLRLRELREVNQWSQAELARRAGVNQSIISRLESGDVQSINFENLEKLATALGCDPGYLIVHRAGAGRWKPSRRSSTRRPRAEA